LWRLNGAICLVAGNHDHLPAATRERFEWVKDYAEIKLPLPDDLATPQMQRVVLCHFPFQVWNRSHHGAWHLHGHSHGNLAPSGCRLDVGVDTNHFGLRHYHPYSWVEICAAMRIRSFVAHDHHSEERGAVTSTTGPRDLDRRGEPAVERNQ
jgi:calcineurin-like phosphoesterase family protein